MATDQGKTSNSERARDRRAGARARRSRRSGLTTFRMPYTPITFGSFAGISRGDLFDPGAHDADPRLGARRGARCSRTSACGSARAISRARGEDMHAAVARECLAVRNACGIFDASTLGKIEVVGAGRRGVHEPPVRQQLDQPRRRAGRATASCCREDGFIYDDGVVARLGARPLPRHHHHRRRAAGARDDGGLPPDRVAGSQRVAHLDHRAVGGHRGARPERAARARAAGLGHRPRRRRTAAHERSRAARSAACRCSCSA